MKSTRLLQTISKASLRDLFKLRRHLNSRRKTQAGRPCVPEELWERAAALARTHGVSRVSRTLGLSYYKLRRRIQVPTASPTRAPAPSGFIELPVSGPDLSDGACVIELHDGGKSRMTIRLSRQGPALLGLAEAFWRRGQ